MSVLRQLVCSALERFRSLQHRDRDVEASQVIVEVFCVIHSHVVRQLLSGLLRQLHTLIARELQQRGGPQRPVEMAMQLRLRQLPKLVREDREWHQSGLSSASSAAW